jgi:hypothetical protein
MTPSQLDATTLAAMRAEATADTSPFIDPVVFRKAQTVLAGVDGGWLNRVIGHEVRSWTHLTPAEMALAVKAAEMDSEHLQALRDQQYAGYRAADRERAERVAAADRARREAWEALRAQLPVPVEVWHNWTLRHCDGYEQGANHIVVRAYLRAGRLRREEGQPLCWTPSRAHELRYVEPAAQDERNIPDCKACMQRAEKLAKAA